MCPGRTEKQFSRQSSKEPRIWPNARLFAALTAELFFRATWAHIGTVSGGTAYEDEFQQLAEKVLKSTMPLPRFSF